MKAYIGKSHPSGTVKTPSSKSYTIRGLVCAALAKGESLILYPLGSDDTFACSEVLRQIGAKVESNGPDWWIEGGNLHAPSGDLFCRDSAATLRFMTAVCAAIPGRSRLTAGASLSRRPVRPLIEAMKQLGIDCHSQGDYPPVVVNGGNLRGGVTVLPGDISSQYVSALLFMAPFASEGIVIRLSTPLESKPYVMMTLDCLQRFGISAGFSPSMDEFEVVKQDYEPARYQVEGDWSSASYFLALGAAAGDVEVTNLEPGSLQGDRMMINFLREMGARIEVKDKSVRVAESQLRPLRADLTDCIDLLPTVAALAALADGFSELSGIERARLKESDRVAAVMQGLARTGIRADIEQDRLMIKGGRPRGGGIDSRNDHRMAMAFSILGAAAGDMVIEQAESVTKTYPEYWSEFRRIGGEVRLE